MGTHYALCLQVGGTFIWEWRNGKNARTFQEVLAKLTQTRTKDYIQKSLWCLTPIEERGVGYLKWVYNMWSTFSVWNSVPSLSWLCPFNKSKVSHLFYGGSLADVSVIALSEQMLYKRKKAKSNVPPCLSHVCGLQVCQQHCSSADDWKEPNMWTVEKQMGPVELEGLEGDWTTPFQKRNRQSLLSVLNGQINVLT